MIGGLFRRHSRINESDQVAQPMVAKQQIHLCPALLEAPDGIELLRELRRHCRSVASEVHSYGATEHAFVGRHPPQAELVADLNRGIRNTALRWPGSSGPHAKRLLMQV